MVRQYLSGNGSESARAAVERYYELFSTQDNILEEKDRESVRAIGSRLKSNIDFKIHDQESKTYPLFQKLAAAAAVVIALSTGLYFYNSGKREKQVVNHQKPKQNEITPGGNKAILSLSDGTQITLNNAKNGILANQKGVAVTKNGEGNLVYENINSSNATKLFNSVSTPRGGQYRLRLSDGTLVWLNAGSVLTYPVVFNVEKREVKLTGEAYFEVSKDIKRPFSVKTTQQKIRVLGTHFNISAYSDDTDTKTTLLEGKVSVENSNFSNHKILRPGEEAITSSNSKNNSPLIKNVDTTDAVAWKNGYFQFQGEPLEGILKKVSRWYDVEIDYSKNQAINTLFFNGTISKYKHASQVLKKLELTGGVHFKIEGRRIIVMP